MKKCEHYSELKIFGNKLSNLYWHTALNWLLAGFCIGIVVGAYFGSK